jgi:hypothetical protein
LFARCYSSPKPPEGIAAFLEKREAVWPVDKKRPKDEGDESPTEAESQKS